MGITPRSNSSRSSGRRIVVKDIQSAIAPDYGLHHLGNLIALGYVSSRNGAVATFGFDFVL